MENHDKQVRNRNVINPGDGLGFLKHLFFLLSLGSSPCLAQIEVGKPLPRLVLKDSDGGRVAGGAFDSDSLGGTVTVIFHVDPDESETNDHVTKALKKKDFDGSKFKSAAIINLAATWKPNWVINSILKSKQKEFPSTLYITDASRRAVKVWRLADDSSNVVLIAKDRTVLFRKDGKLSQSDVSTLISRIEAALAKR